MDIELPSQARQTPSLALLTMIISFTAENSAGATASPAFDAPSASWS